MTSILLFAAFTYIQILLSTIEFPNILYVITYFNIFLVF